MFGNGGALFARAARWYRCSFIVYRFKLIFNDYFLGNQEVPIRTGPGTSIMAGKAQFSFRYHLLHTDVFSCMLI